MANVSYYYGVMGAGKSEELLKMRAMFLARGKQVSILKIQPGTFDPILAHISSRVDERADAIVVNDHQNWHDILDRRGADVVLVDDAQFLKPQAVRDLIAYADEHGIRLLAYGLKADAFNQWFAGSAEWFLQADHLREMYTVCQYCDHKATMNLRLTSDSAQILLTKSAYVPVCRYHYQKGQVTHGNS